MSLTKAIGEAVLVVLFLGGLYSLVFVVAGVALLWSFLKPLMLGDPADPRDLHIAP